MVPHESYSSYWRNWHRRPAGSLSIDVDERASPRDEWEKPKNRRWWDICKLQCSKHVEITSGLPLMEEADYTSK